MRSDVGVSLNLTDSADHYLPVNEYFVVPVNSNSYTT